MNCPVCGRGITFLGTWDKAMQYRCERCKYEISMTKDKGKKHVHTYACTVCDQRTHCDVCGKKFGRWKNHGTQRHSECDKKYVWNPI